MEAFVLFPRSDGRMGAAACEKQLEEEEEDIGCPSESETSAMDPFSSSSEELDDDATSSSSGSTDNFEMSSLMSQLPLKRGLSKFFDGKSQSFASLAAVGGLAEDLAKPPLQKRLKTSRSCGVGLQDAHRRRFSRPSRRCHNSNAANAGFKKVSRGRISLLGGSAAAPSGLTLRPVAARAEGLPGRGALLFA
ncbi:uncharacterized protein LOC100846683 [Brachypodium distachyon]|uniref:Oxidative stress 3 n=1 Tax=Brachypodium distachyon TaxID=15368 RepID=I1J0X9_BRADI|nr:uncharacterized protein LOC100846683 [Brachypodium distachyon]KQJ84200.1 hypothetical protein BRADI_5g19330v3 [Brachypodium distachyon]|eukprot:XP_003581566.1 uncharacterized protein LOC100846683 [Brachypodium distachyon]